MAGKKYPPTAILKNKGTRRERLDGGAKHAKKSSNKAISHPNIFFFLIIHCFSVNLQIVIKRN